METYKRNHDEIDSSYLFPECSKMRKISDSSDVKQSLADPDYVFSESSQPQCPTESQQQQKARLIEIVKKEFNTEIMHKEREIEEIEDRLKIAMKTLQLLRSVCVSSFYNRNELVTSSFNDAELKLNDAKVDTVFGPQTRPHPAVKKIIGKAPLQLTPTRTRQIKKTQNNSIKNGLIDGIEEKNETIKNDLNNTNIQDPLPSTSTIPPATNQNGTMDENGGIRNERFKTRHTIIIGNISKWLNPSDTNPDKSTHKWMVYVRGPKENPDISHIVKKVRFFLHPSYRPNDIIEIKSPPFHLSRRGWGEFPLRIQIHFLNTVNKPIDVLHNLKLDQTHTGLETLGAETVINVWLYTKSLNDIQLVKEKNQSYNNLKLDSIIKYDEEFNDIDSIDSKFFDYGEEYSQNVDSVLENNSDNSIPNSNTVCIPDSQNSFLNPSTNEIPNDNPVIPDNQSNKTLPTTSSKVYYKDGKICLMKNRTRPVNKTKTHISLLKSSAGSNKNDMKKDNVIENNIILVTVRGINEIHDYCKKNSIESSTKISNSTNYDYFLLKLSELKFNNIITALLYLLRHLPIVTSNAAEPLYLKMFPYTAVSQNEFLSWNKAKQFCSEWYRAKFIKKLLETNKIVNHDKWSTKSILKFSRHSGFGIEANAENDSTLHKTIPNTNRTSKAYLKTITENIELKTYLNQTTYSPSSNDELEINVVDDEIPQNDKKIKKETIPVEKIVHLTSKDKTTNVSSDFIHQIVSELGISLGFEEIIPDCWASVAETCILVATKCLAEDLIRRSLLASSCDKSNDIKLEHVKSALLERPEFDIFLNYGLGKRY